MMANSENLFSRSFRGFSPDEVVAYIDELNRSIFNVKKQYESQIFQLNEEISALRNANENLSHLKDELSEKDNQIALLKEEVERLTIDTENQRSAIAAQADVDLVLRSENEELKTSVEALNRKCSAMEENAKEYESMVADVNSILSSARRKATDLIDEAEKKAKNIIDNAHDAAKEHANRIIAESDEKVNENIKKVKYLYRRQDELAEIFKEHKAKVDNFFASLSDKDSKN